MIMSITPEEEKEASNLLTLVSSIIEYLSTLGVNIQRNYVNLIKVNNILINKNKKYYKKIENHLFIDFRMIYDNRMNDKKLIKLMEEAYSIVEKNSIFNS